MIVVEQVYSGTSLFTYGPFASHEQTQPMHPSLVLAFKYLIRNSISLVSQQTVWFIYIPCLSIKHPTVSSISSPVWGRIVDRKGPRIPLIWASFFLFIGYLGIKKMYDDGTDDGLTVSTLHLTLLVACGFIMGLGSHAGISAAINATAKSFPSSSVRVPFRWHYAIMQLVFSSVPLPLVLFCRVMGSLPSFFLRLGACSSLGIHLPSY